MGTKSVNGIVLTTSHTFQLQKEKQTPKHRAKRCTVVCQRKISQALAASSSYSKLPLACKPPADSQTTGSQAWLPAVPAIPDASAFLAAAAAGALHRRDGLHGRKTNWEGEQHMRRVWYRHSVEQVACMAAEGGVHVPCQACRCCGRWRRRRGGRRR